MRTERIARHGCIYVPGEREESYRLLQNRAMPDGLRTILHFIIVQGTQLRWLLQKFVDRIGEREERLMILKKAISSLLGDDDQASISFIFEELLNKN